MREGMGKYRGKRVDNGEFIEGFLVVENGESKIGVAEDTWQPEVKHYATHIYWYVVWPETIGQFTGLRDREGVDVFEGDVVADLMPQELAATIVWSVKYADWRAVCDAGSWSLYRYLDEIPSKVTGDIHTEATK